MRNACFRLATTLAVTMLAGCATAHRTSSPNLSEVLAVNEASLEVFLQEMQKVESEPMWVTPGGRFDPVAAGIKTTFEPREASRNAPQELQILELEQDALRKAAGGTYSFDSWVDHALEPDSDDCTQITVVARNDRSVLYETCRGCPQPLVCALIAMVAGETSVFDVTVVFEAPIPPATRERWVELLRGLRVVAGRPGE